MGIVLVVLLAAAGAAAPPPPMPPPSDGEQALMVVPAALVATGAGLASGLAGGLGAAFISGLAGNRDFVSFVAIGGVVGVSTSWVVTSVVLSVLLDDGWPIWTAPIAGGASALGAAAGVAAGVLASVALFRGRDSCGAEIALPPLAGMLIGAGVGVLATTTLGAFVE